jgi:uncharacterized protein YoxC
MTDDVENHTLALLRKMDAKIDRLDAKIDSVKSELRAEIDDVHDAVDGLTMTVRALAGVLGNHDERMKKAEEVLARVQTT